VAAQDGEPQGAKSQGYGGEAQEAAGYEAPAGAYAAESYTYGEQPAEIHTTSICYSGCAKETPCYDPNSGRCVAGASNVFYGGAAYGGEQTYGAANSYRRLISVTCPDGTQDSTDFALSSTVILWVAFALLFLPGIWFVWKGFSRLQNLSAAANPLWWSKINNVDLTRVCVGVVCLIASLAYLTMAFGHGYVTRCDGRNFYYARYIDWMITTPLMLFDICTITGQRPAVTFFLISMDITMIVAGLIGGLISSHGIAEGYGNGEVAGGRMLEELGSGSGSEKWAFFGISCLTFLPVLYFLCTFTDGVCSCATHPDANKAEKTAQNVINITVFSWFFYPIVWILAEGTGVLSANGEAICYTVLDIIAKSLFGFIFMCSEFGTATSLTLTCEPATDPRNGEYAISADLSPPAGSTGSTNIWKQVGGTGQIQFLGSVWEVLKSPSDGSDLLYNISTAIDPPTSMWFVAGTSPPKTADASNRIIKYNGWNPNNV